jgi:hypothetical protein
MTGPGAPPPRRWIIHGPAIPYDKPRMLAYASPAIIPYALYTLSSWSKSRRGLLLPPACSSHQQITAELFCSANQTRGRKWPYPQVKNG